MYFKSLIITEILIFHSFLKIDFFLCKQEEEEDECQSGRTAFGIE